MKRSEKKGRKRHIISRNKPADRQSDRNEWYNEKPPLRKNGEETQKCEKRGKGCTKERVDKTRMDDICGVARAQREREMDNEGEGRREKRERGGDREAKREREKYILDYQPASQSAPANIDRVLSRLRLRHCYPGLSTLPQFLIIRFPCPRSCSCACVPGLRVRA